MEKDDIRAVLVVLAIVLAAAWMARQNERFLQKATDVGYRTGQTVERLINEETTP